MINSPVNSNRLDHSVGTLLRVCIIWRCLLCRDFTPCSNTFCLVCSINKALLALIYTPSDIKLDRQHYVKWGDGMLTHMYRLYFWAIDFLTHIPRTENDKTGLPESELPHPLTSGWTAWLPCCPHQAEDWGCVLRVLEELTLYALWWQREKVTNIFIANEESKRNVKYNTHIASNTSAQICDLAKMTLWRIRNRHPGEHLNRLFPYKSREVWQVDKINTLSCHYGPSVINPGFMDAYDKLDKKETMKYHIINIYNNSTLNFVF